MSKRKKEVFNFQIFLGKKVYNILLVPKILQNFHLGEGMFLMERDQDHF